MKTMRVRHARNATTGIVMLPVLAMLLSASVAAWAQISPFGRTAAGLSKEDWVALHAARDKALEGAAAVGTKQAWSNPKSGNSGTIDIIDTLALDGMDCRSVRYDFSLKMKASNTTYLVHECKTGDGSWKLL
jgi:surface antigen